VFVLFSFCCYFIFRFVLLGFVDHCLSFFFWSLYCLSFELRLLITLFVFFSSYFVYSNINSSYSTLLIVFVDSGKIALNKHSIFGLLLDHIVVGTKRKRHRLYNGTQYNYKGGNVMCLCNTWWREWTVLKGVRVIISLDLCVCCVDRCLSFCTFSFGHWHCVVCSSSIYGLWLPLWYIQTLPKSG